MRAAFTCLGEAMADRLSKNPSLPGKLASLALLGFLVVILAGPIVAVLSVILSLAIAILSMGVAIASVMLPFALLGLLVWLPCRAFGQGKRVPWEQLSQTVRDVVHAVLAVPKWILGRGYVSLRRLWTGSVRLEEGGREGIRSLAHLSRILFLETASGALVGGSMGLMLGRFEDGPFTHTAIAVGALTGAYLGVLVGLSSAKRSREAVSGPALEELN